MLRIIAYFYVLVVGMAVWFWWMSSKELETTVTVATLVAVAAIVFMAMRRRRGYRGREADPPTAYPEGYHNVRGLQLRGGAQSGSDAAKNDPIPLYMDL